MGNISHEATPGTRGGISGHIRGYELPCHVVLFRAIRNSAVFRLLANSESEDFFPQEEGCISI